MKLHPTGYALLNTDGGMVNPGNRKKDDPPGEAAIAAVLSQVHNEKERIVYSFAGPIGPASKDVAEYKALIEGLRFASSEGVRLIRVYMDAEYIVDQMNNRSNVSSGLRDLHSEAHDLLHSFDDYRISWVPRERNVLADALVQSILYD